MKRRVRCKAGTPANVRPGRVPYFVLMADDKGDRWLRLGEVAKHEVIVGALRLRAQCRVSAGPFAAVVSVGVGYARIRFAISVAVPGMQSPERVFGSPFSTSGSCGDSSKPRLERVVVAGE